MANRIFSLVVLIVAIVLFIESRSFSDKSVGQTFAPSSFPTAIIFIMTVLAIVLLISSFKEKHSILLLFQRIKGYILEHWRVLALIAILYVYISVMPIIGFLISTMLFLLIVFSILRPWRKAFLVTNVVVSLVLPFTIQYVFQQFLNIYLP
ncbi:tripartite tricarboxylate transporter TctB family protein [Alkalihalobacillus sp. MEB130]|uniref:tripartite tricarboxylate transporter TctB family protein n=1 Tax=Alkalihalobacillus sp. MEB130 TaxID=2976704 RepID=UPI0028DE2AB8|nr:tripartite tricarboxylate transporter TctB family protein [Alkalihalobacillus sp. MEB130]MDT8860901.1 tripartite tricarboxylate transporter TctB family protein [Alkalihalobacillus sp. MEB130]